MISAAEARALANNLFELQCEQIEREIKETILLGGTQTNIYYKTGKLNQIVLELIEALGYKVSTEENSLGYSETKISWEE